ncbi:MAG: cytochrome o ubiquinol oxidase subunit III [Simkaniaceae bacterium]
MDSAHDLHQAVEEETYEKTLFGFWVYLLTDFVLFATLFSVFVVLRNKTFGGPTPKDVFDLPYSLIQSYILLTCSLTSGFAGAYAHRQNKKGATLFFILTALLGILFLSLEAVEFKQLIDMGGQWHVSAFLSAFFTLVGTHSVHVVFAILWTPLILFSIWSEGLTLRSLRRATCLKMFWQFLNIVWVFIYVVVYLMGVIQ